MSNNDFEYTETNCKMCGVERMCCKFNNFTCCFDCLKQLPFDFSSCRLCHNLKIIPSRNKDKEICVSCEKKMCKDCRYADYDKNSEFCKECGKYENCKQTNHDTKPCISCKKICHPYCICTHDCQNNRQIWYMIEETAIVIQIFPIIDEIGIISLDSGCLETVFADPDCDCEFKVFQFKIDYKPYVIHVYPSGEVKIKTPELQTSPELPTSPDASNSEGEKMSDDVTYEVTNCKMCDDLNRICWKFNNFTCCFDCLKQLPFKFLPCHFCRNFKIIPLHNKDKKICVSCEKKMCEDCKYADCDINPELCKGYGKHDNHKQTKHDTKPCVFCKKFSNPYCVCKSDSQNNRRVWNMFGNTIIAVPIFPMTGEIGVMKLDNPSPDVKEISADPDNGSEFKVFQFKINDEPYVVHVYPSGDVKIKTPELPTSAYASNCEDEKIMDQKLICV